MPVDAQLAADVIAFRRELHGFPELGRKLPRTQAAVLQRVQRIPGLEVKAGDGWGAVTAVLRGAAPIPAGTRRPVILLRGDMDGLPVVEETGLAFAPREPGAMHACGHDLHTAGLYGALAHLAAHRDELTADVVGMFQPAEETDGGAAPMIAEGVLEAAGRRVDAAFAVHVYSANYRRGAFASRPGAIQSGCDEFVVTVRGRGGHGSTPQAALDPVPVACEMVTALQTLVTRRFGAFEPVVASIGSIRAGSAANIIPETATIQMTLRTFDPGVRERLVTGVTRLFTGIAEAHGLTAELENICEFPVTANNAAEYEYARAVAVDLFGEDAWDEMEQPAPGSEDFAYVLREVPGAYIQFGTVPEGVDPAAAPRNHAARAVFDDALLPRAVEYLAGLALARGPVAL